MGKGLHGGVRRLQVISRARPRWLSLDVEHCFETLPHDAVRGALPPLDPESSEVVERILRAGQTAAGRGLPIGALTSQHFANHTLGAFDRAADHRWCFDGDAGPMASVLAWSGLVTGSGLRRAALRAMRQRDAGPG